MITKRNKTVKKYFWMSIPHYYIFALDKVKRIFEEYNTPVLDVYELINLNNLRLRDLVVNSFDTHPSVKLHRLIGDKLYFLLKQS